MRKRQDGGGESGALEPEGSGAAPAQGQGRQQGEDKTAKPSRRDETSIGWLMFIAFCLAAGYLYYFGDEDYERTTTRGSVRGNAAAAAASVVTPSIPLAAVEPKPPASLPPGCLWSIPELDTGKHIVKPPEGPVDLVCCETTKGVWNIAVHKTWAPVGAANFLKMVSSGFFSSKVGLFRSLKGFLIQFGLAGDPEVQRSFEAGMLGGKHGSLPDDPPWLPLGPTGREIDGVRRFQRGYFAYAGAGKNSRGTQLIVAFDDNLYLGGGSPWEVPFAQLVGAESFATLAKIYTGYGEAPSQGKIRNRGKAYLEADFPLLDYVLGCRLVREGVPWASTATGTRPPVAQPTEAVAGAGK